MKKRKKETVFEGMLAGAKEALAYARGEADLTQYKVHIPEDIDVKAIREAAGLTQEAFALRYGFNLGRLRDLEQKRTQSLRAGQRHSEPIPTRNRASPNWLPRFPSPPIVFAHGPALMAPRCHAIPIRGVYWAMLMFAFATACRRCAELKRGRRKVKSEVRFDVQFSARLEPRWATFGSEPTM